MATLLVTGGAGFIGSCYVLARCGAGDTVINLDKLTYSGNPENFASLSGNPRHIFVHGDIGNAELVEHLLKTYQPDAVVNFAAESHVDRSIIDPEAFVRTNVLGTCTLLRTAKVWWDELDADKRTAFRFLHVSTDEVFGALQPGVRPLRKQRRIAPTALIPLQKLPVTILSGLSTKPTAFPRSSPIVRITMARASFLKNLFRWLRSMLWPARRSPYMEPATTSVTGSM